MPDIVSRGPVFLDTVLILVLSMSAASMRKSSVEGPGDGDRAPTEANSGD